MFLSFTGRDVLVHGAVEQQQADLVVVVDRRERQQRTELDRRLAFGTLARAEVQRRAHVDQQQYGELALFHIALHIGRAHAGGDIPVDGAHVVARHVGTHLVELDAATFEHGHVCARQHVGDLAAGVQLQTPDLFDDLSGEHESETEAQGTSMLARMAATMSSELLPSASAS